VRRRVLSFAIYGLTAIIGVIAFVYPFLIPSAQSAVMGQTHATTPLMLTVLVGLCFVALLLETQGEAVNAKFVALLGILVAMNSALRFLEVAIPGPGGFSPIFFLIVLTGYVYGGRFGFLMGALTLLVSALITGAMGPWLPYQMFTAGWIGMSAPLCRPLARLAGSSPCYWHKKMNHGDTENTEGKKGGNSVPSVSPWLNPLGPGFEIVVLALFAGLWGLVFGIIINLWFWPFATGPAGQYWEPGIGLLDALQRYAGFYLVTSLPWDAMRAVGNVALMLAFGAPTLRALRRFRRRFVFTHRVRPVEAG